MIRFALFVPENEARVMTSHRMGLACLLVSCGLSVIWGLFLQHNAPDGMLDFKGVYYGARSVLHHGDPYKAGEPLRVCQLEGGECLQPSDVLIQVLSWNVYLPTVFIFTAPFALLPWGLAHLLWIVISAGILCIAAFLMWESAREFAPTLSLLLICFLLANCEAVFAVGNIAAIAVGSCVIAVWCFLHERYVPVGIVCLALSLILKPHDAALVWLFLLLAGRIYRKFALQTLVLTVVLGLPGILWVTYIAPNWLGELHANLVTDAAPGGAVDPGPSTANSGSGPSVIINLQSTIALVWNEPNIYNSVTYLVCGTFLLLWVILILRLQLSQTGAWIALASVVPVSMLLTYHRSYDAKLLLLAIPACAMLWSERGVTAWLATLVTATAIVSTADIPLTALLILNKNLHIPYEGLSGKMLTAVLQRPTPLILLAMGVFYLWLCFRHTLGHWSVNGSQNAPDKSLAHDYFKAM
jgi:hypothetical protein